MRPPAIHARWYTFLPPQWSTIPPPLTKTDPEGEGVVIYIGRAAAEALQAIRPADQLLDLNAPVFGISSRQIGRRVQAAATASPDTATVWAWPILELVEEVGYGQGRAVRAVFMQEAPPLRIRIPYTINVTVVESRRDAVNLVLPGPRGRNSSISRKLLFRMSQLTCRSNAVTKMLACLTGEVVRNDYSSNLIK